MSDQILGLLTLFRDHSPDAESNERVSELLADRSKWPEAHKLFDEIRVRHNQTTGYGKVAQERVDQGKVLQYRFDEVCLKAIFNCTWTTAPFDADSPFYIVGNAINFARAIDVPLSAVVAIASPEI